MRNFFDFTQKKYLVTGASSGVGRSTAIELSRQGARVVLVARDEPRLNETLRQMDGEGHLIFSIDLARADDLSGLLEAATKDGVLLNGLVHCAGIATILPLGLMTRAKMDECMSVNFYPFIELVRQASKKRFRAEKMSIVAVSSLAALYPRKCQTVYASSKAALNLAVQSLAIELAEKNIRINSVGLGSVDTKMLQESNDMMSQNETPPQLLGISKPEQIAYSIMYLLSEASSSMTGRFLFADGGAVI